MSDSQGGRACSNGDAHERMIREMLACHGYTKVRTDTVAGLQSWKRGLYAETGCYAQHIKVPLVAHYHKVGRVAVVDFGIINASAETVLLSNKSQQVSGSAEEKLWYEIQQLISTELPAAMFVYGNGFRQCFLEEIWELTRHFGGSRVYLFRTIERLTRWIREGVPVSGRGVRNQDIWAEYCDRQP
jgi:hypothetical protein